MKLNPFLWCILLLLGQGALGQVKIGENSETIDPSSLLELESPNRVLVITRVTTSQMESISPSEGAIVYNTDSDCLFYYNGQRWLNICEALGLFFTAEPIENEFATMLITRVGDSVNFEVGQIRGGADGDIPNNIVDGSVRGEDIGFDVVTALNLAPNSVGNSEIEPNSVTTDKILPGLPNQVLKTTNTGLVAWSYPLVMAWGKYDGGSLAKESGIDEITPLGLGEYQVFLGAVPERITADYTVHVTALGDYRVFVSEQNLNDFTISVRDSDGEEVDATTGFYITVIDN